LRFTKIYIVFLIIAFFTSQSLKAQDLEPRSLSVMPTGGNFAVASYGYSKGNIMVDNSLPIENLEAKLNSFVFAYAHSFKLFNKLAKFDIVAPYSFGTFTGIVYDLDSSTSRTGFADPLARLSIVLLGAKPLKISEYANKIEKKFKLGVSFRLRAPLGQYDNTKLINIGANRWAFKTSIAGSYSFTKKIILEGKFSSWFFTENKEFWNGNTIEQKPLISAQLNLTYIFKPGVWAALSFGQSGQGETIVNGVEKDDLQQNSRMGVAFAYRIAKKHAVKIAVTSGVSTRYGANFTTILVAYQFMWFGKNSYKK